MPSDVADRLAALVDGGANDDAGAFTGRPALARPSSYPDARQTEAIGAWLESQLDDAEFSVQLDALDAGVSRMFDDSLGKADGKKPFDISGMSSSQIEVLTQALALASMLRTAYTDLHGKLGQVSFDAATAQAKAIERQGVSALSGSVAQGAMQLGFAGAGAGMQAKGLARERGALGNQGQRLNHLDIEARGIKMDLKQQGKSASRAGIDVPDTPNAKRPVAADGGAQKATATNLPASDPKLAAAPDVSDTLAAAGEAQRATPDGSAPAVQSSEPQAVVNRPLTPEQKAVLEQRLQDIRNESVELNQTMSDERLQAQSLRARGDFLMQIQHPVAGLAAGASRYASTLEESQQQIAQASARVASTAADDAREGSHKASALAAEVLRIIQSSNESRAATMASIANNRSA
ncbi:hypothetical protein WJ64_32760 [Burkholderia ubonensis]|nr:hypothetical protein WJ64_32760 [Burkholderia ubonensis]